MTIYLPFSLFTSDFEMIIQSVELRTFEHLSGTDVEPWPDKRRSEGSRANLISRCQLVADCINRFQKCCCGSHWLGLRRVSEGGVCVMRGQPPSKVGLPEPWRNANFMVNWASHLDSQHCRAGLSTQLTHNTDHTDRRMGCIRDV